MNFSEAKIKFDQKYGKSNIIKKSLVPVDGKFVKDVVIKDSKGNPNEEYYNPYSGNKLKKIIFSNSCQ
jgi:hypothetical protein